MAGAPASLFSSDGPPAGTSWLNRRKGNMGVGGGGGGGWVPICSPGGSGRSLLLSTFPLSSGGTDDSKNGMGRKVGNWDGEVGAGELAGPAGWGGSGPSAGFDPGDCSRLVPSVGLAASGALLGKMSKGRKLYGGSLVGFGCWLSRPTKGGATGNDITVWLSMPQTEFSLAMIAASLASSVLTPHKKRSSRSPPSLFKRSISASGCLLV